MQEIGYEEARCVKVIVEVKRDSVERLADKKEVVPELLNDIELKREVVFDIVIDPCA